MKATKVYSIELLFAMEPQIGRDQAEALCDRLLEGVREYLASQGFIIEGGSVRSATQLYLGPEPGDDVTQLGRSLNQVH